MSYELVQAQAPQPVGATPGAIAGLSLGTVAVIGLGALGLMWFVKTAEKGYKKNPISIPYASSKKKRAGSWIVYWTQAGKRRSKRFTNYLDASYFRDKKQYATTGTKNVRLRRLAKK